MSELSYIPGDCMTLGVSKAGRGINFAVAVGDTDEVILKLFKNAGDTEPYYIVKMDARFKFGNIFAVTVKNFTGRGYTYIYEAKGVSFVDPYAGLISGREVYGKYLNNKQKKLIRAYVCPNSYEWKCNRKPSIDFSDLIIYKLHVRGFSKLCGTRGGTYRGVADKVNYFKELGINAIMLMPCMEYNEVYDAEPEPQVPEFVSSRFFKGTTSVERPEIEKQEYILESERKINYWGYTSFYYFFAPKASYANVPAKADYEFKYMVDQLHQAGIEVIMEVSIPRATNRSMMLDALRYWAREYRIDGFKLNLDCIDSSLIACDPYLSTIKLIGCGWNTDEIYPKEYTPLCKRLAIYNHEFSSDMRRFLKSDEGMSYNVCRDITDNQDKVTKINYITDHNGFTLADLYMYDVKHNEANGEHGRDGTDVNYSWNCGVEGPDNHKKIKELRLKMRKNAFAALLLSQGVPLIYSGDEFGNSQGGNNNAYCQDNETSWLSWKKTKSENEFFKYVKELIELRKSHNVFHNINKLKGLDYLSCGLPDVSIHSEKAWYPDYNFYNRSIGVLYAGNYALNNREPDNDFYLMFNMYWDDKCCELPHPSSDKIWILEFATDKIGGYEVGQEIKDNILTVPGRCVVVLKSKKTDSVLQSVKRKNKKEVK